MLQNIYLEGSLIILETIGQYIQILIKKKKISQSSLSSKVFSVCPSSNS